MKKTSKILLLSWRKTGKKYVDSSKKKGSNSRMILKENIKLHFDSFVSILLSFLKKRASRYLNLKNPL